MERNQTAPGLCWLFQRFMRRQRATYQQNVNIDLD